MPEKCKPVRQSVSLAPRVARRVRALANAKRSSASRVIAELVEVGLENQDHERQRFLDLAERFANSRDPRERERLKEELARLTFGS
jgi:DNA-binding IclR family transcriptional regulator